jgi:hypothetical protein
MLASTSSFSHFFFGILKEESHLILAKSSNKLSNKVATCPFLFLKN